MNTKQKSPGYGLKQLGLKLGSPLIAFVAVSCAFLVETEQVDYSYPLELVLKNFTKDPTILTICTR